MPELPEVETIVRSLEPRIRGRTIAETELLFPPLLRRESSDGLAAFRGLRILEVRRRGKMILIACEGGRTLVFHLKMTGRLDLCECGKPVDKHTRLILRFRDGADELRFHDVRKFGFCILVDGDPAVCCGELAGLGPEPLEIGLEEFAAILAGRKGRIKAVLLDQAAIAGIGNIYADEILFDAGIHPETPASKIKNKNADRLRQSMRHILDLAIAANGSTLRDYRDAGGCPGGFQSQHKVYGREGEPCAVCGRPIRRIRVAGRSTHFCPLCQKR
ncbi:MAG: bifunctional DNA-formamidopyrimidine glycosylase/DNA-(apurinic or apyrimidinic site) lyase [Acidobacteriota bacterium]|nr:bifunctional DNA-formamidopyrimidine glycosylase/DNA-(apurinic or apyrimidinic site) lyase [Acidobacteriota bacterium]